MEWEKEGHSAVYMCARLLLCHFREKKNIFTNTDLEILTVKMHYFVSPHSIVNGR